MNSHLYPWLFVQQQNYKKNGVSLQLPRRHMPKIVVYPNHKMRVTQMRVKYHVPRRFHYWRMKSDKGRKMPIYYIGNRYYIGTVSHKQIKSNIQPNLSSDLIQSETNLPQSLQFAHNPYVKHAKLNHRPFTNDLKVWNIESQKINNGQNTKQMSFTKKCINHEAIEFTTLEYSPFTAQCNYENINVTRTPSFSTMQTLYHPIRLTTDPSLLQPMSSTSYRKHSQPNNVNFLSTTQSPRYIFTIDDAITSHTSLNQRLEGIRDYYNHTNTNILFIKQSALTTISSPSVSSDEFNCCFTQNETENTTLSTQQIPSSTLSFGHLQTAMAYDLNKVPSFPKKENLSITDSLPTSETRISTRYNIFKLQSNKTIMNIIKSTIESASISMNKKNVIGKLRMKTYDSSEKYFNKSLLLPTQNPRENKTALKRHTFNILKKNKFRKSTILPVTTPTSAIPTNTTSASYLTRSVRLQDVNIGKIESSNKRLNNRGSKRAQFSNERKKSKIQNISTSSVPDVKLSNTTLSSSAISITKESAIMKIKISNFSKRRVIKSQNAPDDDVMKRIPIPELPIETYFKNIVGPIKH